jgi:HAD superfamily hydrolase (TIGR01509 family)
MIRAVLLDMGGVLLSLGPEGGLPESRFDWRGREALVRLLEARGGAASLEELEHLLFAPWRAEYEQRYEMGREARWEPHLRRLRRRAGVRLRDLTMLAAWFRPYGDQLRALPGAGAALATLRDRGVRLAVCSNVPLPGALYRRLLVREGLAEGIQSFHFSYDEGSRKPSPAMLRAALAGLGVQPRDGLMVGDRRSTDVAAGRAAGLRTVWIRSEDGGGPQPDHTIRGIGELPALLARVQSRRR